MASQRLLRAKRGGFVPVKKKQPCVLKKKRRKTDMMVTTVKKVNERKITIMKNVNEGGNY